jgi:hypothetical protein
MSIKIDMVLQDGGSINKKTGETKALNGELTKTQKLARSAFSGQTTGGAGGGGGGGGGGGVTSQAMMDYNRGRSAIGTGAEARDFANQAQGLGGLVRVYATFAANLFAVSAAFNALKNAADTTNLLKGLEQLGTASGVNLPKVAKELAAVSDGAISLRDAMTATAQASSAGMSAENIKRMGEVARNAAQALGVDMSNALDRLSRGITKLEPELLDEIGIFTRTEQASIDYARALGKSVGALTSFEKRQAFANAVLAEGEEKFGAIALQTNPYNKLLASLKNLTQEGLELVNKVLGPLIDGLSKSPVALGAAIAAVAAILLKQAIPALTQWRTELSEGVERASASAAQNLEYFRNYQQDIAQTAARNINESVKNQVAVAGTAWKGLQKETRQGVLRSNEELKSILKADLEDTSKDSLQRLDKLKQQYEKAATVKPGQDVSPAKQAAQARMLEFSRIEPELRKAIAAQQDYNKAVAAATPTSLTVQGSLLQRIANNAELAERKMRLLANAVDNAAFSGPISAMRSMNASIAKLSPSIGIVSREMLRLRATVTIAAVAVSTLTSAFGNLLGVIGIIAGVGMLLNSVFSKNEDEAAKATKSIDDLKSSGDNLDRVLESISKKTPLQQLSSQSIAASAVAMGDLTSAINQAIKDTDASIAARGWFDSFTNALFSVVGKSDEQVLEKTITKQLNKILKAASSSIDAAAVRKDLVKALGLKEGAGDQDIIKAFTTDIKTAGPELQKLMDRFKSSAQSGKAFSDNLKELQKTFQDMTNELLPKGKIVDAVNQSTSAYSDLSKLLDGPVTVSLAAMNDLLNNTQALSMLPPGALEQIMGAIPALDELTNRMATNQLAISNATIELEKYNNTLEETNQRNKAAKSQMSAGTRSLVGSVQVSKSLEDSAQKARDTISRAQLDIASDSRLLEGYKETFRKATEEGFKANSELLSQIFGNAAQKARIQTEQTALSKLPVTPEVIDRQTELQKRQIDLDAQGQLIQSRLIIAQEKTNVELALLRITIEKDTLAKTRANDPDGMRILLDKLELEEKPLLAQREALKVVQGGRVRTAEQFRMMGMEASDAQRLAQLSGAAGQIREATRQAKSLVDFEATIKKIGYSFTIGTEAFSQGIENINNKIKTLELTISGPELQTEAELQRRSVVREQIALLKDQIVELTTARELLKPGEAGAVARVALPRTQLSTTAGEAVLTRAAAPVTGIVAGSVAEKTQAALSEQNRLSKEATEQTQRELNRLYDSASVELKLQSDLAGLMEAKKSQELDYESQLLEIAVNKGTISKDDYAQQQRALQLKKIELEYQKTLADLDRDRRKQLLDLQKEFMDKSGGTGEMSAISPEDAASLFQRADAIRVYYDAASSGALNLKNQQTGLLSQQEILLDRQQEYGKIFESTFDKMADAIVQFAQTGKLNFKDLINSMLADLLRYELRLQMMEIYKGVKPGLMNLVGSLFGGGAGSTPGYIPGLSGADFPSYMAKGGAFNDDGIMKYAKGGTFTNSIVSSPTLFKFAKGTGLMGEAGPEAIMPLKRDSQGNLGVRGGSGGSVEVVVNNYSQEKATARETTDSRGNRRVEVIVGEAAAGEFARTGSPAQNTMKSTYGLTPSLIRR